MDASTNNKFCGDKSDQAQFRGGEGKNQREEGLSGMFSFLDALGSKQLFRICQKLKLSSHCSECREMVVMNCTPDSNKDWCKFAQIYHQATLQQCKTSNLGPIIKLSQFPFH